MICEKSANYLVGGAGGENRQFIHFVYNNEHETLLERQNEGIELAKLAGKYKGREFIKIPENFMSCLQKYNHSTREHKYSIQQFMNECGLKKSTLLRLIKEVKFDSIKKERLQIKKQKEKQIIRS